MEENDTKTSDCNNRGRLPKSRSACSQKGLLDRPRQLPNYSRPTKMANKKETTLWCLLSLRVTQWCVMKCGGGPTQPTYHRHPLIIIMIYVWVCVGDNCNYKYNYNYNSHTRTHPHTHTHPTPTHTHTPIIYKYNDKYSYNYNFNYHLCVYGCGNYNYIDTYNNNYNFNYN